MKHYIDELQPLLRELTCDRCGAKHKHPGTEFFEFTSVAYQAGYGSIFGDGNQVEIDLCQDCLRATLSPWLRVHEDDQATRLRADLAAFKPEAHGGEFPGGELGQRVKRGSSRHEPRPAKNERRGGRK